MLLRSVKCAGTFTLNNQVHNVFLKRFAAVAALKNENTTAVSEEITLENARPFSEIPGPSKLEFLRGVLPGGKLYNKSIYEMFNILSAEYGTFLRMPGMFGTKDMYIAMNPDDYPIIFRNEGKWPVRRNFDTLNYYRNEYRKDFYGGMGGLTLSSGEQWGKERSAANPILMQPRNVMPYLSSMLEVNDEFLQRVREIRDPVTQEMPDTFVDDLLRLTLESVATVALNTQLGLIRKNRETSEANKIITSMRRVGELAFELDIKPSLWKIIKTPKFYEMMNALDTILNVSKEYINESLEKIEQESKSDHAMDGSKEKSVLEKLTHVDKKFAVIMAMDLLLAGVDTTTSTMVGILLCIAKNPEQQAKLFEEIRGVMPQKCSHLSVESMRNLPYLRACIKEGIRMYPIITGTMRTLPHDVVLSGYRVEKGTDVSIAANLLLQNEQYVPQAAKFIPERWLRTDRTDAITNPFMYVPFGFGPRSCVGKRIVDLELEITIARLVRNFNIEFNYPTDNAFRAKFINVPSIPLKFKFEERIA